MGSVGNSSCVVHAESDLQSVLSLCYFAAVSVASVLKIKPILTYIEGVTDVVDRPRTKKVALECLWAIIDKHAQKGIEYVGFQYGTNRVEVEGFQHDSADGFHPVGDT